MLAENAVLGGEGNGGVIDPRVGYVRDSFVAMALVLDLLAATGEPLSHLVGGLPRYAMVKDQYPLIGPDAGRTAARAPTAVAALWDRIAAAFPDARADRRDGLRLDWDDRWVHVRAQQYRADRPGDRRGRRAGAGPRAGRPDRPLGRTLRRRASHEPDRMAHIRPSPAVAFVDVDGTLLAQTTTFLFARILYRRGLIRRSFFLRALYHGLQHRFGRLDYGRLIAIGLKYIARIPVVELERIAYENFVEFVRPRLYEGVVEHLYACAAAGTAIVLVSSSPGLVIEPLEHLSGLHRHADDAGRDRTRPLVGMGSGPPCYGEGKLYWAEQWAHQRGTSRWKTRSPTPTTGAIGPCSKRSAGPWSSTRGRLLRLARARGWDIVRPRRPSGTNRCRIRR